MQKRLKLKPFVLPTVYVMIILTLVCATYLQSRNLSKPKENLDYVNGTNLDDSVPVISTEKPTMGKPFLLEDVTLVKDFYDYKSENTRQENAIIYYEGTYMPNSGLDYQKEDSFDVVAVLDGTVIDVKQDDLLGNVVEIRHENDFVSTYQSLGTVTVKKDDKVQKGQVIGTSGENNLDKDLGKHLHFELYKGGQVVDPLLYFDKTVE